MLQRGSKGHRPMSSAQKSVSAKLEAEKGRHRACLEGQVLFYRTELNRTKMLNCGDPASEPCGHSHHNVAATFAASLAFSLRSLSCALLSGVPLPGCRALELLSEVGMASARAELHSCCQGWV